jgi:Zn-dependent metalloprotease
MLLTMILLLGSAVATSTLPQVQAPNKTQKQRQLKPTKEGQPDPSVLNSWEELKSRSGQSLTASWNESGTPRSIFGKIDKGHGTSEGSARAFLRSNSKLFKLSDPDDELTVTTQKESVIGTHVVFDQVYRGVKVDGGQVGLHYNRNGELVVVNNSYQPDVVVDSVIPRLSSQQAINELAATLKLNGLSHSNTDLVISKINGAYKLAWRVTISTVGPTWEALIDAQSGRLLNEPEDINRYVNGLGQVFNVNAVVATHDPTLRDNGDAASAVPVSAYRIVTLQGLTGSGFLEGTYAASSKTKKQAFDPSNSFIFDRSNDGFSETMGYYYLDYAERYIQSLGFTNINNRQQVFSVNRLKIDNSFYAPNTQEISYGLGGVDDAEDAEVILHEYGHSIQDNQVPGFGTTLESGAMGEGFGDYWAGSVGAQFSGGFQDECIADWDSTSYSNTNPPCLRRLDGTKHYPEDVDGEVHDDGEIWSAALWQIRGSLGATRADTLILSSQFLLAKDSTFNQASNALVTAGISLGFKSHDLNVVRTILRARGFTVTV